MRFNLQHWGDRLKQLVLSGDHGLDPAAILDASPNPYVLLTLDLKIVGVNQAFLQVTFSQREAIIGQPIFSVFTGGRGEAALESVRQVRASMERAATTRKPDHLALVTFAMRRHQPDGSVEFEERLWSATHTPIFKRDGTVGFILQHTADVTELEQLRRSQSNSNSRRTALDVMTGGEVLKRAKQVQLTNMKLEAERNRLIEMFMQAPGFVAVLTGPHHVFQLLNPAYSQLIGHREIIGKQVVDALPEVAGQGFVDLLDQVYRSGEPLTGRKSRLQLQREPGARLEDVYLNFVYQPIRDEDGEILGIFVHGHDVTNDVVAADRQKLMIDELNHRVKNTLATVQSIAMQTARSQVDILSFTRSFQSRLIALSHTHDLLTRSHWEGAEILDVLLHETQAHGHQRIKLEGPSVSLSASVALSLGMIVHELATNAAKYGALSTQSGLVTINWSLERRMEHTLVINWRETGGPRVQPPTRRGFGARLIERNIRHDLRGTLVLEYAIAGLHAQMSFPLNSRTLN